MSFYLQSQTLEAAFELAGANQQELKAVLEHYKDSGEEEKYKAAVFLIENITIQQSKTYKWVDFKGKTVDFSEFNYEDFSEAVIAHKKLKDSFNIRTRTMTKKDAKVITSKVLIKNIDLAFKTWKENPWSQAYDFDTFCEYILPYRSLIEPLEEWREECAFLVKSASNNLEDETDPVEVCTNVLNALKDFSFRYTRSPIPAPLLGTQQLLFRREGSCPELANLAVLASRAIGLAVTFDYTPHYAASSNRHYWNAIIDKNGKAIPFNGSSASDFKGTPNNYNANNKRMAKVVRQTYAIQEQALASRHNKNTIPYGYLRAKNIIDVTNEYMPVEAITYSFGAKDSIIDVAYLNVFNTNSWREVHWTEKKDGVFTFSDMGRDIVYLPSCYIKRKKTYGRYPILLDEDGVQKTLTPNFNESFDCTLSRTNEFASKYRDENNSVHIEVGETHILYYWNNGWQKLGASKATRDGVSFKNVPANALFLLLPDKSDDFERIFTIDSKSNTIKWY